MLIFVQMRRQQQVETLKAAMDEAHDNAQREKHQKRMQHLEEAGHDVSHLKANLLGNDLFKCLTMCYENILRIIWSLEFMRNQLSLILGSTW